MWRWILPGLDSPIHFAAQNWRICVISDQTYRELEEVIHALAAWYSAFQFDRFMISKGWNFNCKGGWREDKSPRLESSGHLGLSHSSLVSKDQSIEVWFGLKPTGYLALGSSSFGQKRRILVEKIRTFFIFEIQLNNQGERRPDFHSLCVAFPPRWALLLGKPFLISFCVRRGTRGRSATPISKSWLEPIA